MTGFGQAVSEDGRHRVSVALRAFNHRYLDLQLRLGEEYQSSEAELRQLLTGELFRGRVEGTVTIQRLGERPARVEVNRPVLEAIQSALEELAREGLVQAELQARDLFQLPEAFRLELEPDEWTEKDHQLLLEVAKEALSQLVAARAAEGEKLATVLAEKIDRLSEVVARLESLWQEAGRELRANLENRLEEMLGERQLPEDRLVQEAAALVERSDVREELDRLRAHGEHFGAMARQEGPVGKRLDFIVQEMFRELNTVGAKCRSSAMTRDVVDGKMLCEQLREQVQNVE